MAPTIVHLPNGQHLTVTPVFGGLYFKSNELSSHHAPFPPGWTVVINTEDEEQDDPREQLRMGLKSSSEPSSRPSSPPTFKHRAIHRFTRPTMDRDHLFISSISQPNSSDFRPNPSPTRQIAMMLWATLWWYFHEQEPDLHLKTAASFRTVDSGKPKGAWRININREGVFKSKVILPKLERMGLIATEECSVGSEEDERTGEGWLHMFVSRRHFWQLDPRIYLFTLAPVGGSPFLPGTPVHSRPGSPSRQSDEEKTPTGSTTWPPGHSPGPFHSSSHLPTFYPPTPPQFIVSDGLMHPLRPKPPRQGEPFYTRFVPSVGQYISFRVASLSPKPHVHRGPVASAPIVRNVKQSISDTVLPTIANLSLDDNDSDSGLLYRWMNEPRVAHYWGEKGSRSHQEEFLRRALKSHHSFPAIGYWDSKPFGYFEIYWAKEDSLGRLSGEVGNYDRGIHCLVGEQEFRGPHRVKIWLSALVHYCWLTDLRTETVLMEPRVDNDRYEFLCFSIKKDRC